MLYIIHQPYLSYYIEFHIFCFAIKLPLMGPFMNHFQYLHGLWLNHTGYVIRFLVY